MDNALFPGKQEQICQIFSQPVSQSLWSHPEFCFSDLPLKGANPKLPAANTRILGHSKFSYQLKLVNQYKMSAHSLGKENIPWTGSSAHQFPWTLRTLWKHELYVCMYISVCMYLASQLSFLRCTELAGPLTKSYLFVEFFLLEAQRKKMQHGTQLPFPNLPWSRWTLPPGFIFVCSSTNKISHTIQADASVPGLH